MASPVSWSSWLRHAFGPHGQRWCDYWANALTADPLLRDLTMCVDLTLGGDRTVRLATRAISSTSSTDSIVRYYRPLLNTPPAILQRYTPGSSTSAARSMALEWADEDLDIPALIAAGRPIAGTGEVSLQLPGGDWDHRIVIMHGEMADGVEWDGPGTPVRATLSDLRTAADQACPPWVIDDSRWANLRDDAVGRRYPLVLGRYQWVPAVCVDNDAATPQFVAAWGWGHTIDLNTGVAVDGSVVGSTDDEYPWSAVETYDLRGDPVTVIQFAVGVAPYTWTGSEQVNVTIDPSGTCPADLMQIVELLARDFTGLGRQHLARDRFARAAARLGTIPVGMLLNASGQGDGVRTLEAIESSLLAQFPMVSMCWGLGGYGPVVTDRDDTLTRWHLTAGAYPLIGPGTGWRESARAEASNAFALRYSYNPLAGDYTAVVTRDPSTSALCQLSQQWAGDRVADPLDCPSIDTQAVADLAIDWTVRHDTLPAYDISYPALPVLFLVLDLGDNVTITDADFGWSSTRATVLWLDYDPGTGVTTLVLRVWAGQYGALGGGSSAGAAGAGAGP